MNKIKILMVLEATLGGTRRHVVDLLENIDTEKYSVTFAYAIERADKNMLEVIARIESRGIKTVVVPMTRKISLSADVAAFFVLVRLIRRGRYDIVHTHSSKAGFLGRIAAKLVNWRIITVYTPNSLAVNIKKVYMWFERFAGLFTDKIIAVSESERDEILRCRIVNKDKVVVINSGVNINSQTKKSWHETGLKVPPDSLVVTAVARFTRQKNPLSFYKIARSALIENPHLYFLWIGDGELRGEVEEFIKANKLTASCMIAGWRTDIDTILAGSDMFLITSLYEGLPYSIMEAMASGLPVVATDVVGTRNLVVHEKTGYLFPVGKTDDLSKAVLLLAHDEKLRHQLGENGKSRIKDLFWLPKMVKETQELYEKSFR